MKWYFLNLSRCLFTLVLLILVGFIILFGGLFGIDGENLEDYTGLRH